MIRKMVSIFLVIIMGLATISNLVVFEVVAATYKATIGELTIPFADYPSGSYFTDNGGPCTDHNVCGAGASYTDEDACNCKCTYNGVALNATSCMGFASMVFYRLYGHTIYSNTTKVVSSVSASIITNDYLYDLFANSTVKPGAHVRSNSGHSMIYMGCDNSYIYMYEANWDGQCQVRVKQRTWTEMANYFINRNGIRYIQMPTDYPYTNIDTEVQFVPVVSVDKVNGQYGQNEAVQFYCLAENATVMYLTFYKDGERREDLDIEVTNTTSISKVFSDLGYYEVYLYVVTPDGDVSSETIGFNILPLPKNVQVNTERTQYSKNESVQFYYSAEDATAVYLTFYKDGERREDLDINVTNTSCTTTKFAESGYYEAYICAVNSNGQTDSPYIGFYVQPGPANVNINTDKQIYSIDEEVKFSYGAEDADEMYLAFYKNGTERADLDVNVTNTSNVTLKFSEAGFYEAYICAVNANGQTNSYSTWFNVIADDSYLSDVYNGHKYILFNTPIKWGDAKKECERLGGHLVTITSEEEQKFINNFMSNGTKEAYWMGASENLEKGVWEWVTGESYVYSNWDENQPSNTKLLEHYAAVYKTTEKWNDFVYSGDYMCGFICEFDYVNTVPYTNSTVMRNDNTYNIETELYNISSPANIIVVGYKNGEMTVVKTEAYSSENEMFTLTGDIDTIKVMVWDSISSMKPVCDVEVIPSGEWITE